MKEHKLFINGDWVESSSGETFDDVNPATLEVIAKMHKASDEDVQRSVDAAEDAFENWSCTPAPIRAKILFRTARRLEERKEELARLMTTEMGKILKETRGDV